MSVNFLCLKTFLYLKFMSAHSEYFKCLKNETRNFANWKCGLCKTWETIWYDTKDIVSIVLFKSFWEIFCNLFLLRCSLLVWSFRDPFTTRPVRTVFRYSDQVYRPLFTCILMYNKNNSNLSLKRNVFKLILSLVVLSPVPPLSNIHIS